MDQLNKLEIMKVTSKNYNESFRKVTINEVGSYSKNMEYLVWFNYREELYKAGKCFITAEFMCTGSKGYRNITKVIDIPYEGEVEKADRYNFFDKHKKQMESFALWFHVNPYSDLKEEFSYKQLLKS